MRLTQKQEKQKRRIEKAEGFLKKAQIKLWNAQKEHECVIGKGHSSAVCMICKKRFGWWCSKSSDHLCRYLPGSEWCKYCGDPDERKQGKGL